MQNEQIYNNDNKFYRTLVEKMREGVIKVDADLNIVYCNPVLCEMFGYKLDEIAGQSLTQFLDLKNQAILAKEFSKRKDGYSGSYEMELIVKDNQKISVNVLPHPIFNEKGEFEASFSVISNITKLKETEKKLKQSEAKYRLLIENIPSVVWSMDNDGTLGYISSNAEKIFGFPVNEIHDRGIHFWMEQVYPEDLDRIVNNYQGLFSATHKFDIEYRFYKKDGSMIWLHSSANIIENEQGISEAVGIITDITHNKKNEIALRRNEDKLKAILNNHFQLTGLLATDGKVLDVNDASLENIGIEKNTILNKYFWDTPWWNHDTKLQKELKHAIKIAAHGVTVNFEAFHYNRHGEIKFIDFSIKPVVNDGKVLYMVPQGFDITERRKITQSLLESKKRYQALFESASDGISILKGDKFVECNNKTLAMFECERDQIIGKSPIDFSPEFQPNGQLSKEQGLINIHKALAGELQEFEWTHTTLKGKQFICQISLSCLEIDGEKYLQVFNRDITDKKHAEEYLIESEEKYRNLVELANDGVVILQDSVIKYTNKSFLNMLDYTLDEVIEKPFSKFVYPEDVPRALDQYRKRITGQLNEIIFQLALINKHNKKMDVELNSARIQLKGRSAIFVYIRDISDRLKMQEKLAFSEKLSTIGELSRKVAHEIGNPLSSILHSAHELGDTLALQGDEKILMDIILKETKRLDEIIKNFLSFSRPKNSVFQKTDLATIINELLLVFQNDTNFKSKNIEIQKNISDNVPAISADPDMIKEVLWNLLLNARDAIVEKGKINIILTMVWMNGKASIELSIKDTGSGIPEKSLEKIFEPYYTSKFSGSGLGLTTVKRNIEKHDGVIMVNSKMNYGTEFIIHLPIDRSEEN